MKYVLDARIHQEMSFVCFRAAERCFEVNLLHISRPGFGHKWKAGVSKKEQ
jgi:hypothetical protein